MLSWTTAQQTLPVFTHKTGSGSNNQNQTTSINIGQEAADRRVYVTIGYLDTGPTLSSATINSVSATVIRTFSGNYKYYILAASVPTGTTVDLTLNFSADLFFASSVGIVVYAITGQLAPLNSSVLHSYTEQTGVATSTNFTTSTDYGGFVIVQAVDSSPYSGNPVFTGTGLVEENTGTNDHAVATARTPSTYLNIDVSGLGSGYDVFAHSFKR